MSLFLSGLSEFCVWTVSPHFILEQRAEHRGQKCKFLFVLGDLYACFIDYSVSTVFRYTQAAHCAHTGPLCAPKMCIQMNILVAQQRGFMFRARRHQTERSSELRPTLSPWIYLVCIPPCSFCLETCRDPAAPTGGCFISSMCRFCRAQMFLSVTFTLRSVSEGRPGRCGWWWW